MFGASKTATLFVALFASAMAAPSPVNHGAIVKRFDQFGSEWWSQIWRWPFPQPTPTSYPSASAIPSQPVTTAPKPSVTVPASPPSNVSSNSAAAKYVAAHNHVRSKYAAQPLSWSNTLAAAAQKWANNCRTVHSGGSLGPYGENLAWGPPGFNQTGAVNYWAAEAPQFNPTHPMMSHFTQVVWKSTHQVGCASATCPKLINNDVGVLHVCEYFPPGNYIGETVQNVAV